MTREQKANILILAGWQCLLWSSSYGAYREGCGDFFGTVYGGGDFFAYDHESRHFHTEYRMDTDDKLIPWPDDDRIIDAAYAALDAAGLL